MTNSLQTFQISDLAQFTSEGALPSDASSDFLLMFVGRDNVHEAIKHVVGRISSSFYCNMYGYDDEELNEMIWDLVENPSITVLITLDKSQAGGVHEKRLLDADRAKDLKSFNTHFAIGQSSSHQISHTKGFCADGLIGAEGSTNWSVTGEGFFVKGAPGKSQNNTQTFFRCPYAVRRFQAQLIAEHMTAVKQLSKTAAA